MYRNTAINSCSSSYASTFHDDVNPDKRLAMVGILDHGSVAVDKLHNFLGLHWHDHEKHDPQQKSS